PYAASAQSYTLSLHDALPISVHETVSPGVALNDLHEIGVALARLHRNHSYAFRKQRKFQLAIPIEYSLFPELPNAPLLFTLQFAQGEHGVYVLDGEAEAVYRIKGDPGTKEHGDPIF